MPKGKIVEKKVEVNEKVSDVAVKKVKVDSLASDQTTTAPGIHEGKVPKFGKTEFHT